MLGGPFCPKAGKPCTCGDVIAVLAGEKPRHPCNQPGPNNGLNTYGKPWCTEPEKPAPVARLTRPKDAPPMTPELAAALTELVTLAHQITHPDGNAA